MPGIPQRISHCPITPECGKRLLFIDVPLENVQAENVFAISSKKEFVLHICSIHTQGRPELVYLGEWLNVRTKRTRYMGPFRTRAQAEKSPKDDKLDPKRRGSTHTEWELIQTLVGKPAWKTAPEK